MSKGIRWRDAASPWLCRERASSYATWNRAVTVRHIGPPYCGDGSRGPPYGAGCTGTRRRQDDSVLSRDQQRRCRGAPLLLRCSVDCSRRRVGNFGMTSVNYLE